MGSSLTRALSGSHGGKSTGDARRNRMTITNQKGFPKHEGGSDQEDQSSISAGPVFGKVADPKEKKVGPKTCRSLQGLVRESFEVLLHTVSGGKRGRDD